MSDPAPAQEWWSAAELAASGLPDLPGTKRKVNEMAKRDGWKGPAAARRRRRDRVSLECAAPASPAADGNGGGQYAQNPARKRRRLGAV
jgi:hypothetical protein